MLHRSFLGFGWFLCVLLTAALPNAPLLAATHEHSLHVLPRYAARISGGSEGPDRHGCGLSLMYGWGIDDFWNLQTGIRYLGWLDGRADPHLLESQIGVAYTIDVLTWVPYFRVMVGLAAGGFDSSARLDGGVSVGAGLDYRRWRRFAIGVDLHYEALFRDIARFPALIETGLHFTIYFDASSGSF